MLISFRPPFVLHSYPMALLCFIIRKFCVSLFLIMSGLVVRAYLLVPPDKSITLLYLHVHAPA
jgi:hypothetical protein